jgi:ATP-dependent helicase/nuclease subunit A
VNNGFPAGKEFKAQKEAMLAGIGPCLATRMRWPRWSGCAACRRRAIDDDAIVRALARLMTLAAAELWLVFREAGEVDFGELAARAIDAPWATSIDPTELGLRLDWRIRHLLVDEFQDTSPTQVELLERLTAGWQRGRRPHAVLRRRPDAVDLPLPQGRGRPVPARQGAGHRRLGADVAAPVAQQPRPARRWWTGSMPASRRCFRRPRRAAARRDRLPALRRHARGFARCRRHGACAGCGKGRYRGRRSRIEAERMVQIIEAEWTADPQRRIAVLVRARDHLSALVAAIRRHVPVWRFTAVEIEPLAGRQVVQDLISLTRALHHRGDRLHWLAILRAPWCGLRLADMHVLAGDDHDATIPALLADEARIARLSADGRQRALHLRMVMDEALAGQSRQSRRRWVEDVWRKLGGPCCLSLPSGAPDASALADADAYFKRLDELDAARRFALDSFEEDMARLFAAPDAEADGRLQLMTIHKAKGLEFDTVILPGLHRSSPAPEPPLLAWDSFPLAEGERLVVAPMNRRRRKDEPTTHDFLQAMERERAANESARVLYVAVTRAVRHLHLLGVATRKDDGSLATPAANSLLARLWPVVERDFAAANVGDDGARDGDEDMASYFMPPLLRQVAPTVPLAWQAPASLSAAVAVREDTVDALAADIGSLVHALLEMAAGEPDDWSPAAIPAREPGFARWLAGRGWGAADASAGAQKAARILATTLASVDGQWVLRSREDAGAELAIARVAEGGTGAGTTVETRVVDRSFVEDGVRWIIDYKTADLGPEADAARLAAHAERYRPQLETYAALFAGEARPLRLAVFFAAHGILSALE